MNEDEEFRRQEEAGQAYLARGGADGQAEQEIISVDRHGRALGGQQGGFRDGVWGGSQEGGLFGAPEGQQGGGQQVPPELATAPAAPYDPDAVQADDLVLGALMGVDLSQV